MDAFDQLPPELRSAIANAPYAFSGRMFDVETFKQLIAVYLAERDRAKVGPVPTTYTKRRRRRR